MDMRHAVCQTEGYGPSGHALISLSAKNVQKHNIHIIYLMHTSHMVQGQSLLIVCLMTLLAV
jgi:hypothetical protein